MMNSKGSLIDFNLPKVMGILNLTPDSYYAKSRSMDVSQVIDIVGNMVEDGVDILDVGATSTRPGSVPPSQSEEIARLTGPLAAIRRAFPQILISIDTFRTEPLKACLDFNINMINDVSGGSVDPGFLDTVASSRLPYILMHAQGKPETMQQNPKYVNVILDLLKYFDESIHYCHSLGIKDIIIDPGFGFGKTREHNFQILAHLSSIKIFDLPLMVGLSRKSMIYKPLNIQAEDALPGTMALHMLALKNGANLLRAHDVKEAKQCIKLWSLYRAQRD